ncbi:S8 family serine peptidase [Halorussus gelatinilyticus]|uniref:S8 family serine peptidase n=1 Tax=Halorussus gelatinilyticus TaxID=2937524 RepID=A0A8U0IHG1_9EURY|nr:S8 family serine peptidase [Halorussus gelatinilyticus]UPV99743.1 S8 family serine peptidase [Halorussus gelatinilyticus]
MVGYDRRSFLKVSGTALGGIAVGSTVTVASSDERFLVDSSETSQSEAEAAGLDVVHALPEIDLLVVEGAESDVESLGATYAADSTYSLDLPAGRDSPTTDESASDEPRYSPQWDKQAQNVPEAHEITRGEGTRVAVIDTGVAAGHPDLQHAVNEDLSKDFTGDGYGAAGPYGGYHGTHVAANDRNEVGTVGSAPGTEIVDCRVFSPSENASFADIVAAVVYSARIDCDAANMSLGAYPVSRTANGQFYGKVLNRTTSYAKNQGTVVVTSAGNDAADLQHDGKFISLPNEAANVLSVSATGPLGFNHGADGLESPTYTPANYTNYGTNAIDVAAPGGNYDPDFPTGWYYDMVLNTLAEPQFDADGDYVGANYTYSWIAGTSMAAPQVAGAVALVRSQNPGSTRGRSASASGTPPRCPRSSRRPTTALAN